MGGADVLEIRLSGAVEVLRDGVALRVPGRRTRALLVLLALAAERPVTTEALAKGIWAEDLPERVRGSLQTYVGRLRRVLGDSVIATVPNGYQLQVPRSAVDLLRFADRAARTDDADSRADGAVLRDLLAEWTGDPFGEPPSDWIAEHEVPAWTERRLQVLERWIDLCFDAGDYESCLIELRGQVDRHPLRESLWLRLLTALDNLGRTAEALERYEQVRKQLAEELGVDPCPELRAIYQQLLSRGDEPATATRPHKPAVPRHLPPALPGFVGRQWQLDRLDEIVEMSHHTDDPVLIALHGTAGAGKTTLAAQWAHHIKDRFPDGQLFLNLQGYGPGERVDVGRALMSLLRAIGVRSGDIPLETDERAALWRTHAQHRRMLVLLDNVHDAETVRTLLPGSESMVLVTSRNQLRGLAARDGAQRVIVDRMPSNEAVELLSKRIGGAQEPDELEELAVLCDHLPVALAVAAERAGREETRPLEELIRQLRDRQRRLDTLVADEEDPLTSVRAVFEWSYRMLDAATARLFRLLGLYQNATIVVDVAAALEGSEALDVERRLDRLTASHLLGRGENGRYHIHDLLAAFAAERIEAAEREEERTAATQRLRSWHLHTSANASDAIAPPAYEIHRPPVEHDVAPRDFPTADAAYEWFDEHIAYLRTTVRSAATDDDPVGYLLAPTLVEYLDMNGTLAADIPLYELARASAAHAGDAIGEARCANCLLGAHLQNEDLHSALECATHAATLYDDAGDTRGRLMVQNNRAVILQYLGRHAESISIAQEVVDVARRAGLTSHLAATLLGLSEAYRTSGRFDDALQTAKEATELTVDNRREHVAAVQLVGDAYVALDRPAAAIDAYQRALEVVRGLGPTLPEVEIRRGLGFAYRASGNIAEARGTWQAAIQLLHRIGTPETHRLSVSELTALIEGLDDEPGSGTGS